jgi:4-hydroxy-tetrahydrodipicolinate synthase
MALQARLLPLHDAMFVESNPGPVKYAASLLGFGTNTVRLPLVSLSDASAQKVRAAMVEVGLLN